MKYWLSSVLLASAVTLSISYTELPRQDSLVAYFPFDAESGLNDITGTIKLTNASAKLFPETGPFGASQSAFTVAMDGLLIGTSHNNQISLKNGFTAAFFFYIQLPTNQTQGDQLNRGAVFTFDSLTDRFIVKLNPLPKNDATGFPGGSAIETKCYQVNDASSERQNNFQSPIFQPGTWNFAALTYNGTSLTLYGGDGAYKLGVSYGSITALNTLRSLYVGYTLDQFNGDSAMTSTDALACLAIYNSVLTDQELADLPYGCQMKGKGTPRPPTNFDFPSSLAAFWPFDDQWHLTDLISKKKMFAGTPALSKGPGPFGEPNTAYTSMFEGGFFGYHSDDLNPIILGPSFTFGVYFYSQLRKGGSIIMFGPTFDQSDTSLEMILNYNSNGMLEVRTTPANGLISNATLIARIPNVLKANAWSFIGITYEQSTSTLKVFDGKGQYLGSATAALSNRISSVFPGYGWSEDPADYASVFMKPTDAIACIMYFNAVLTPIEIAETPKQVCRDRGSVYPITTPTPPPPSLTPWPRPEALLGFWPLNDIHGLTDVSQNEFFGTATSQPVATYGPYGDEHTAKSPAVLGNPVMAASHNKLAVSKSFSVTLFISVANFTNEGGIFEFIDSAGSGNSFQLRYANKALEVAANGETIGWYFIIMPKGAWTFLGLVFDGDSEQLTVYSRNGVHTASQTQSKISASMAHNNNGIQLGYTNQWHQGLSSSDKVSCLMVYSAALSASEIRHARDACRFIHGSPPCGSPRLPIAAIPPSGMSAAVPNHGQFPYIASVRRDTSHVCSATIIDQFWLLTSAACFRQCSGCADPSRYTVYLGEQDLNVAEPQTRIHPVSKVIMSEQDELSALSRDVALIELLDPIDFTNIYVNEACLLQFDEINQLALNASQFVFGRGENGRKSLVSPTLPRYFPGTFLTERQCQNAWNGVVNFSGSTDFCFLSSTTDKDVPCHGDEGSPLLAQVLGNPAMSTNDRLVQLGVYYGRDSACSDTKPGLFSSLVYFNDWVIESIACAIPGVVYPSNCLQH